MTKELIRKFFYFICTSCCLCYPEAHAQLPNATVRYIPDLPVHVAPRDIIRDARGLIWMGYVQSPAGLYIFDGHSTQPVSVRMNDSTALSDHNVNALHSGPDGKIWIGTYSRGIFRYDPKQDVFEHLDLETKAGMAMTYVHDFYLDKDSIFWISGVGGLIRYEHEADRFTSFRMNLPGLELDEITLLNRMRVIEQDDYHPDRLWIGTLRGLIAFDKVTEAFTYHEMPFSATQQIATNNAQYLVVEVASVDRNTVAVGTWSGGLMLYNVETGHWTQHRDSEVEPIDDVVYRIEPRNENELWVATTRGFGLFNIKQEAYALYDSIPTAAMSNQIGRYASAFEWLSQSEAIVLGSIGGAVLHFPEKGPPAHQMFPPLIRRVEVDHQLIQPFNLGYPQQTISLTSGQSAVTFDMLSPSLQDGENIRYRYQLLGVDRLWREHTGPLRVTYDDLHGGKFSFQYQASLDGITWMEGQPWAIEKYTSFWQASELKFMAGGVLASGLLLFFILSTRQRRKRLALERSFQYQLAQSEMSALRAQMNPHFIFNSLNSIKNYVLKQDTAVANKYLTRFSHLMRLVLRNSKATLITLADELQALDLYIDIEKLRFDDGFESVIRVDDTIDPEEWHIPPMLIQPYVENAIWHGLMHRPTPGRLTIEIVSTDQQLRITIEDNGVGRKHSAEIQERNQTIQKSFGTEITRDRVRLIRQSLQIDTQVHMEDLYDATGNAAGTRVHLVLPMISPALAKKIIERKTPV